jgi:hypothetical protein
VQWIPLQLCLPISPRFSKVGLLNEGWLTRRCILLLPLRFFQPLASPARCAPRLLNTPTQYLRFATPDRFSISESLPLQESREIGGKDGNLVFGTTDDTFGPIKINLFCYGASSPHAVVQRLPLPCSRSEREVAVFCAR